MKDSEAFEREDRYIVIKRKHLSEEQATAIDQTLEMYDVAQVPLAVVVEGDWPEYETVWKMIEGRVTGIASQPAQMAPDGLAAELAVLDAKATPGPWYRLDPPWISGDVETTIMAESPDPHVARFICDFDFAGMFEEDDGKKSECPDADADLILALRNSLPAIIASLSASNDSNAMRDALTLARNRLQALAVRAPFNSAEGFDASRWADEATEALNTP
ncbi:hypothetical protein [Croceicoccus mobilis]|uniref:Uncharacterized protein n=1 Tax=Croceicoccus mobilis TaxID=1703339 RepID=A0A916Z543_9SPHN|nr:hypothetical protein [Croceicoccus mobilis]GGD74136.1 hypothetical protein GCM10010990_24730 [Croceicoccus mobilis]